MTPFEGVVFDLDGTLVDNMPIHATAFGAFVERHGLPPSTRPCALASMESGTATSFPFSSDAPWISRRSIISPRRRSRSTASLSKGRLAPLRGLARLLALLEARGIPFAIATSAPAENVPHTLREIGLEDRFAHVARSDTVARGKPHPDVFLAACELMGRPAPRCIAFDFGGHRGERPDPHRRPDGAQGRPPDKMKGKNPEHAVWSPDGKWPYVSAEEADSVDIVDLTKNAVVKSVKVVTVRAASGSCPTAAGPTVAAENADTVNVFDTSTHEVIAKIKAGSRSNGVLLRPDGKRVS